MKYRLVIEMIAAVDVRLLVFSAITVVCTVVIQGHAGTPPCGFTAMRIDRRADLPRGLVSPFYVYY